MTDSNPFVLPGMGQDSELSGNPLLASMEMMRQAWAGLAGPGGLGQSLPMTPPMNLEDLERRIAELRTVEGWLRLNLQMLSSSIQGMEVQRATIATLRSFVGSAAATASNSEGEPSPLEVALGLRSAKTDKPAQTVKPEAPADSADAAASEPINEAAQSASRAWWELLNQQFSQIAAATAATAASLPSMMPGMDAMAQAGAAGTQGKPAAPAAGAAPKKAAPRKTAKTADSAPSTATPRRARTASKAVRKTPRAS
ncbi:PhaM family polyhydroxyalkanoate granule multifunctional regulatory protein [Bordetella holmesii]|uniref:N-acetyltransferase YedL n=5 Tax=Bordetella holmesii TaxID=35814 RepID=A0ABP3BLN4_9BORD|nr:PhaM family polyhydroxyalkanoate granule multifunctional regulatory protein [Bordetella holmesii]AHV94547.1 hypothetical protein D560_1620 [Bordetella holmesii ATCC 51541]AIT26281.1 hypothetical protein D558_1609 [Bordetella holmesii 44057]EWM44303.1 hypothetical protein D556_1623 [Bordetella holmesii 41130]EWM46852.1 hypothetical protein D555_1633 [Bordetella holmesii 35009]EWM51025.1 hypothetical protein D557_0876 [Bordetella holmesii 70147]